MAAVAAITTTLNIRTTSPTTTRRKPTTQFPLTLHTSNTKPKTKFPFSIHCSRRPDTESNNASTNNTPIVENESNLSSPKVPISPPNQKPSFSSSIGLVLDLGAKGSWDSYEIGSPVVKRFISDDEERWYMWYYGSDGEGGGGGGGDVIGLAVSNNGVHWEKGAGPVRSNADVGLVMSCSKDWWAFDTEGIRPSEVVIMSSSKVRASSAVYWLYYTGVNAEKVEFSVPVQDVERGGRGEEDLGVLKSLPGLAISQDGRHWARIEGEHHSGALFDVGAEGEWDSLFVAGPQVVFHSRGDLRMYYYSFDAKSGKFGVGLARSRDGIKWVKLGKIIGGGSVGCFDEFGVKSAHVMRNQRDGGYVMAYEGVAADGGRSIGLAVSGDGLKDWRRCGDEAVLTPPVEEDAWDKNAVGFPCLVQMDGKDDEWRLYYRGIGEEGKTGIGLAVSEGSDFKSFRRWTGFHL